MTRQNPARILSAALLLLLLFITTAVRAQTKPAVDLSTPTEAMLTFARSGSAGDVTTALSVCVGTDEQRAIVARPLRGIVAYNARMRAYDAQFGGKRTNPSSLGPEMEKVIRNMPVTINGDTATVIVRNEQNAKFTPVPDITLRKDANGWKLDLASYLASWLPRTPAELAEMDRERAIQERASDEIIAGVDAGAYESGDDAEHAYRELVAARMATTRPAEK